MDVDRQRRWAARWMALRASFDTAWRFGGRGPGHVATRRTLPRASDERTGKKQRRAALRARATESFSKFSLSLRPGNDIIMVLVSWGKITRFCGVFWLQHDLAVSVGKGAHWTVPCSQFSLSKLGSLRTPVPTSVFLEYLTRPSI